MKPNIFYLIIFACVFFFTSCSQNRPQKVYLEYGCKITIPTPVTLGNPFTAHHSLNFQAKEKSLQMQAQLEFENNILTIVGLNTAFATIFSLRQVENKIEYIANIKTPIKPKFILGTYYLIFMNAKDIPKILPSNVTCQEDITPTGVVRKIFIGKRQIFNIEYLPFKNGTKITFHNLKRDLVFTIIEDYRTNL